MLANRFANMFVNILADVSANAYEKRVWGKMASGTMSWSISNGIWTDIDSLGRDSYSPPLAILTCTPQ